MAVAKLSGYVMGELLGQGGMGTVYAAQQPALKRTVAVKVLHPDLVGDASIVERFHTEALAGSRLSHPNIAGVIDFGLMADGAPFLVMEHIQGERLGRILQRTGVLPVRRACELVRQLLAGLDAAHAAGVIHADVKSDNILVAGDHATLIDFGIARLVDRPPRDEFAEPVFSGTPEYVAPEVIGGAAPTASSDVYGAGVVLYELLVGHTPFHGGSSAAVFRGHLEEAVIAPSLRCPEDDISVALDAVVLRALAKDPAQRYGSAAEFAAALVEATPGVETRRGKEVAAHLGFSTEAPTQDFPVRRRLPAGTRAPTANRAQRLRAAIGSAIVAGDPDAIARAYLELARSLVVAHRADLAAWELEQAIDVLTAGEGPKSRRAPEQLWRMLLALAAIYVGVGDTLAARRAAQQARTAALVAHEPIGVDRADTLLRRVEPTA